LDQLEHVSALKPLLIFRIWQLENDTIRPSPTNQFESECKESLRLKSVYCVKGREAMTNIRTNIGSQNTIPIKKNSAIGKNSASGKKFPHAINKIPHAKFFFACGISFSAQSAQLYNMYWYITTTWIFLLQRYVSLR